MDHQRAHQAEEARYCLGSVLTVVSEITTTVHMTMAALCIDWVLAILRQYTIGAEQEHVATVSPVRILCLKF